MLVLAFAPLVAWAGLQPLEVTSTGHPATRVRIDGLGEHLFVVDTGASASAVYDHARKRLGLKPVPGAGVQMHGAGGSQRIERYRLPALSVAGVSTAPLLVGGLPAGIRHGDEVMGVVGRDVFGRHLVEIDLPGGRLGLHAPEHAPGSPRGWDVVPMRLMPGTGFVMLEVMLEGRAVTAVLDTGARRTFINWRAARQAGIKPGAARLERGTATGGATAHRFSYDTTAFESLRVGTTHFDAPAVSIADLPVFAPMGMAAAPAMILGIDVLGSRRFVVDYPGRRLLIEKPAARD